MIFYKADKKKYISMNGRMRRQWPLGGSRKIRWTHRNGPVIRQHGIGTPGSRVVFQQYPALQAVRIHKREFDAAEWKKRD